MEPSLIPSIKLEEKDFILPPEEFDVTFDPGERTALHLAIANKHSAVVNTLLRHTGECGQ